jgi:hypothetical protein
MEQKLIPFDDWIKTIVLIPEEYYFIYDSNGNIQELRSSEGLSDIPNKIKIDNEIAYRIYDSKESLNLYKVNTITRELIKFTKLESQGLTKIDDILHRIIDKKWTLVLNPDILINYDRSEKLLTFKINPILKSIEWVGEQNMIFLVTDYNDPNVLREMISFTVAEIISYPQRFTLELPEKFSIYTRRIFDKYTYEDTRA